MNRRKCILFVNDKTLFNFLVPDVPRQQIRELDRMFRNWLPCVLVEEGFAQAQTKKIVEEYRAIGYSNTKSRSVLGSMNEFAFMYKFYLQPGGGLHGCDFPDIIKRMNRTPMGSLGYQLPIEALFDIF